MRPVLYHFIQFSNHTSWGPQKSWNFMFVMEVFRVCQIHFGTHVTDIQLLHHLQCWTAEKFPKIWVCHSNFGGLPKPNFRQACHMSWALINWLKWYSITFCHPQKTIWTGHSNTWDPNFTTTTHNHTSGSFDSSNWNGGGGAWERSNFSGNSQDQ